MTVDVWLFDALFRLTKSASEDNNKKKFGVSQAASIYYMDRLSLATTSTIFVSRFWSIIIHFLRRRGR